MKKTADGRLDGVKNWNLAGLAAVILSSLSSALASNPPTQLVDFPVPNGSVTAVVSDPARGVVYLGGNFTRLGPFTGAFVGLDTATAAWNTPTWSRVVGSAGTSVPDGSGGFYIAGAFTKVGGESITSLAHLRSDGTLDPAWHIDLPLGTVYDMALQGNTLYLGGSFSSVGSATRQNLAAIDVTTATVTSWDPNLNYAAGGVNGVYAITATSTTVYVGGLFAAIGTMPRHNLGAVDAATGVVTSWAPAVNANPVDFAIIGGTLYMGGNFTTVDGSARPMLAAFDLGTGALLPFALDADSGTSDTVNALAAGPSGTLIIGGQFSTLNGSPHACLAQVDAGTGVATAWNPDLDGTVYTVAASGTTVYAGGDFSAAGADPHAFLVKLDVASSTAAPWDPAVSGNVQTLNVSGGTLFAGGAFGTVGGVSRSHLAAVDAATGAITAFSPEPDSTVSALALSGDLLYVAGDFSTIAGAARNKIAALDLSVSPAAATAFNPGQNFGVGGLVVDGATIYAYGGFTFIGGAARNHLAALDAATGAATAWDPGLSSSAIVNSIAVDAGAVYVAGSFSAIGGQSRKNIAAIDKTSAVPLAGWSLAPDAPIKSLALSGSRLYASGDFSTIGGVSRDSLAALNTADGSIQSWTPTASGGFFFGSPSLLAATSEALYATGDFEFSSSPGTGLNVFYASTAGDTSWDVSSTGTPQAFLVTADRLYLGGQQSQIGDGRPYFAAFDTNNFPPAAPATPTPTPSSTPAVPATATVQITGKKSVKTTASKYVFKGHATVANGTLTRVEVKVGKAGYKAAKGTTSWKFTAKLKDGKNKILVRAVTSTGVTSSIVKVTATRQ